MRPRTTAFSKAEAPKNQQPEKPLSFTDSIKAYINQSEVSTHIKSAFTESKNNYPLGNLHRILENIQFPVTNQIFLDEFFLRHEQDNDVEWLHNQIQLFLPKFIHSRGDNKGLLKDFIIEYFAKISGKTTDEIFKIIYQCDRSQLTDEKIQRGQNFIINAAKTAILGKLAESLSDHSLSHPYQDDIEEIGNIIKRLSKISDKVDAKEFDPKYALQNYVQNLNDFLQANEYYIAQVPKLDDILKSMKTSLYKLDKQSGTAEMTAVNTIYIEKNLCLGRLQRLQNEIDENKTNTESNKNFTMFKFNNKNSIQDIEHKKAIIVRIIEGLKKLDFINLRGNNVAKDRAISNLDQIFSKAYDSVKKFMIINHLPKNEIRIKACFKKYRIFLQDIQMMDSGQYSSKELEDRFNQISNSLFKNLKNISPEHTELFDKYQSTLQSKIEEIVKSMNSSLDIRPEFDKFSKSLYQMNSAFKFSVNKENRKLSF